MGASASVVDTRESYASEEMKVVIALAVIALFGSAIATGSAPAGYEVEVDVLPEDDELVQAQAGDFFGEVARLKQPAKASWTKRESRAPPGLCLLRDRIAKRSVRGALC